jgi:hypothetical protein
MTLDRILVERKLYENDEKRITRGSQKDDRSRQEIWFITEKNKKK